MKHLSDEQLGARLDGELPPGHAEPVDRHLAECAECRDRLAALTASDASLARALVRDPGETYFASFADRVSARIAAGAADSPAFRSAGRATQPPGRGWLQHPATLAWAGAAAALVAVGAFALQFATQQHPGGGPVAKRPSILGADSREKAAKDVAPPTSTAPSEPSAEPPAAEPSSADEIRAESQAAPAPDADGRATREKDLATSQRDAGTAAPTRAQPVKTQPNGEPALARMQRMFAAPPAGSTKPGAQPMQSEPVGKRAVATTPLTGAGSFTEAKGTPAVTAPVPAAMQTNETQALRVDETATVKRCGRVSDTAGRALANVTVTIVENGRSTRSDADGRFCLDVPAENVTLSVMSVGYHESRTVLQTGDTSEEVAVNLSPVSPLGSSSAPVARFKVPAAPAPTALTARPEGESKLMQDSAAPATIPALPGESAQARAAREATDAAMRLRTAAAWSKAGTLWEGVASGAGTDAPGQEARYRAAEARMSAWRLARGTSNEHAAAAAVEAFLAKAPAGARRTSAEGWRAELPAH